MPKKQPIAKANVTSAAPARVAKPRNSRVTAAKHSKAQALEPSMAAPVMMETATVEPVFIEPAMEEISVSRVEIAVPESEDPRHAIAKIAYGYWETRGCQGGNAHEDWVRAEMEYLSRSTAK